MNGRNDAQASDRGRVYQASGDQHIFENHHYGPSWSGPASVRRAAHDRSLLVFRDRVELMDRLRASVSPDSGSHVYVLHGLGGCGKTAIAGALFAYATADTGRVGLWVNASDGASLRSGMLAVAADRGSSESELTTARSGLRAASDLVWEYLDRSEQPWLLVIDNADDPGVLHEGGWLRASQRGTVVVTTRQASPRWWPGAELLHVDVLPLEDAAMVLCDLAPGTGTAEEAADVAERLGRLPLALTLAGTFLSNQVVEPWDMSLYGRRLVHDRADAAIELIDRGGSIMDQDARNLVSSTWQLSLDALADKGLPEAQPLLRLLACWGSDPLPVSLLAHTGPGPGLPQGRLEPALRGLLDSSLTELLPGPPRCLRTHGVLLDSAAGNTPVEQRVALATTAADALLTALPEVPERGEQADAFSLRCRTLSRCRAARRSGTTSTETSRRRPLKVCCALSSPSTAPATSPPRWC
ncbi:NB-ARC domain-containing protein [Streptomyces sp. NPDC054796]